jgi:Protein of unknown function (DUF1566)
MKTRRFLFFTIVPLMLGGLPIAELGGAEAPKGKQEVSGGSPSAIQNRVKVLPDAQRFVVLPAFNNEAVLDNVTGLVWERSPQATSARWMTARRTCIEKNVGGQKGWRLPSLEELTSLVDSSIAPPGPTLPPGHPFLTVQSTVYWSATRVDEDARGSWAVHFGLGGGTTFINWAHSVPSWCVRDGAQADQR